MKDLWYLEFFDYKYFLYLDPLVRLKDSKYETEAIIQNSRLVESSKVLDLCCGYGRHLSEFAKQRYKCLTGVDLSNTLISYAKQNANSKINYIQDDAKTVKLPKESFDFVCILGTSLGFHTNEEPDKKILEKAKEVLKPGGKILIEQYNMDPPKLNIRESKTLDGVRIEFERKAVFTKKRIFTGYCRYYYPDFKKEDILWFGARMYTKEEFLQMLRKVGFINIRIFGGFDFSIYDEKTSPLLLLFAEKKKCSS